MNSVPQVEPKYIDLNSNPNFLPYMATQNDEQENAELSSESEAMEMAYSKKYREILPTLPRARGWYCEHVVQYQGCWLSPDLAVKAILWIQEEFKAQPTDVFLASFPKTGTTWLKSLIFATINRNRYDLSSPSHPLRSNSPHECIRFLHVYVHDHESNGTAISGALDTLPPPRLLAIHYPFSLLPKSMVNAPGCKFVYVCREPKDVLISKWLFCSQLTPKNLPTLSLQEAFELFCRGIAHFGPYWEHVLGYWEWSLTNPEKVLFLKYEELKREPLVVVKRLAEFLSCPFSVEEESNGVVQEIIKLCSFESLSNLEVNKRSDNGKRFNDVIINNNSFFRKGQSGDSKNHLTNEMIEHLDKVTREKLAGSGFSFGLAKD